MVVLTEDTTPLEIPPIAEYHPNGSNLWHIRDWGIASMFGYLRERRETDPPEANQADTGTTGDETEMPGFRPRRTRPTVQFAWAPITKHKRDEDHAAEAAGHPRPDRERGVEEFPDEVIKAAWRRQGGRCANCGRWLVWGYRNRGTTGAWESHWRIPASRGGRPTPANCLLLCSGVADCHFSVGHGGIAWSHYATMDDLSLLFLSSAETTAARPTPAARRRRNLLREVFGIPQSRKD